MARRLHARRYAQAIFEIGLKSQELDRWQTELRQVASLREVAEVLELLHSPKIRFEEKVKLLKEILPDISPTTLNLVYLLVARGRLGMIGEIAAEYEALLNSYRGIEQAEVITAIPLSEEDKLRLKERLKSLIGKEIILKTDVDPGLIGGVVVRVGYKLIDGSTQSQLTELKKGLAGAGS